MKNLLTVLAILAIAAFGLLTLHSLDAEGMDSVIQHILKDD